MSQSYFLCILDFEATCHDNSVKRAVKHQMEIIEFPSVLYFVSFEESRPIVKCVGEFHKYVKPIFENGQLSAFCTSLTGITQSMMDNEECFPEVLDKHCEWLKQSMKSEKEEEEYPLIFATCGHWDLATQFPKELRNKRIQLTPDQQRIYRQYINVKDEFQKHTHMKARGMAGMLVDLAIPLEGRHHSGIDDTRNIAKIMLYLIEGGHHSLTQFKIVSLTY